MEACCSWRHDAHIEMRLLIETGDVRSSWMNEAAPTPQYCGRGSQESEHHGEDMKRTIRVMLKAVLGGLQLS